MKGKTMTQARQMTTRSKTIRRIAASTFIAAATVFAGAASISTADASSRTYNKRYNKPKVSGNYLDVCYKRRNCSSGAAANKYCRSKGYQKARSSSSFIVPLLQTARRIGDYTACTSTGIHMCNAYRSIVCTKTVRRNPVRPPKKDRSSKDARDAALIGLGTALIGGIIAGQNNRNNNNNNNQEIEPAPSGNTGGGNALPAAHYDWCFAKYRSYRAATNTYTSLNGRRRFCNSPYI